jgi:hypothetical protein
MISRYAKALSICALAPIAAVAMGQFQPGWYVCYPTGDPPPDPHSADYGVNSINGFFGDDAPLMNVTIGVSGTVTMGGQGGPCFSPAITVPVAGRIGFGIGPVGSIQSDFDDGLQLTMGMPFDPAGTFSYAVITTRDAVGGAQTRTVFGSTGFTLAFRGASDRYIYTEGIVDNVNVRNQIDILGDAARVNWRMRNLAADNRLIGLWFGQWIAMINNQFQSAGGPSNRVKNVYVTMPGRKPPVNEQRYIRAQDPANFPPYVNFNWGQTEAYGLRVENGPTESTLDAQGLNSDATPADEFVIGEHGSLLGPASAGDSNMPDFIVGDRFWNNVAYIQKFYEQAVPSNQERVITQYFRTTWADSNYSRPYSVVVDPPKLLAFDPNEPAELSPNPFRIRVYVDNTRGFSAVDREIPLEVVKVTLTLPEGMNLLPGQTAQKVIQRVEPRRYEFVEFDVEATEDAFGELAYQVKVEVPSLGAGATKTINGRITVSATPRLRIREDANLVSVPWIFNDSSWENILQLDQPSDFRAFQWDPVLRGYVLSTSAERGAGAWIVANDAFGAVPLGGNPQQPPDITTGAPLVQLKHGWNLIGNPYNYAFPIGQIVGAAAANPIQSFTWQELVQQGFVSGSLAWWDSESQSYRFIQGTDAMLQPHRGYWVYVFTIQDVTLSFPPIFREFLPGSSRVAGTRWTQSDNRWRLQLVARTNKSVDDQNFVGVAGSVNEAKALRIIEPPMGPTQDVAVSIEETIDGRPTRLAKAMADRIGRTEWRAFVDVKSAGPVTVTWPNLATVPNNVRFRLVDVATGATRDMRQASGYTFSAEGESTREFRIQMEPGAGSTRPVIGNVVVTRPSRDRNAAFTINYTLSSEASTTIRIVDSRGREVYTVARGRADRVGENTATWTLRDNANRSVAPGTYRVEIVAETANGERVRKHVPVNVIR